MRRFTRLFVALLVFAIGPGARADLAGDVRAVLNDKLLSRGQVSVEIIRLGDSLRQSQTIFQHNAATPRIPASSLKIITTAAALEKLGPKFEFKTTLALRGPDVAIIGDGDPALGDAELLRRSGWAVQTVFQNWAELLRRRGINQVRDVCVDDSIFDEVFVHPNWPAEQQHKRYVAQVGGVNLNVNCVDFYVRTRSFGQPVEFRIDPLTEYIAVANTCVSGSRSAVWLSRQQGGNDVVLRGQIDASNDEPISVTVHDPPMFAATVLAETLAASGVKVTRAVRRDRTIRQSMQNSGASREADGWVAVAIHSTPIPVVIARANKDSMNLYAEALCKRLGAAESGKPGSWQDGVAAMGQFLGSLGVAADEFVIDDGSGLSKKNAVSANAIARVLEHEFHGGNRELFRSSLAVAGVDGTFENRFKDSDLRGRVFGKSGYVSGVSSLSGYLRTKGGRWYAFSILMNGLPEGTNHQAKLLQERIVKAIDAAASDRAAGQ